MSKEVKIGILVLGIITILFCLRVIVTRPAYDHSQDAVKAAEKIEEEKLNERAMAINKLVQLSVIENNQHNDVYVVVARVWDENLGTYRIIGERKEDGFLFVLTAKEGAKVKIGQEVKVVVVTYPETAKGRIKVLNYFTPL